MIPSPLCWIRLRSTGKWGAHRRVQFKCRFCGKVKWRH